MSTPSIDVADQLECAICTDQLWEPKLLNCGHTFCLKCLDELFDPEENPKNPVVACPLCRKKTPVPGKGVAGLNSNFALLSLLEALSPLKPTTSADVTKIEDGEATVCEVHDEVRKFYCCSCEVLICRDCTVVDHPRPEHKCMNLDEAYTWRRQLNERELQLSVRVVKLAKRSKGILQSTEASLNERCDQVIAEIEKCREVGLEMLQVKTEAIEAFQVDLEAEIFSLHDLTEDASKKEVLDQSKSLVESMTSLRNQQNEMLSKPEPLQYPVFIGASEDVQEWPRLINLSGAGKDKKRKQRPKTKRQQSDGEGSQSGEGTAATTVIEVPVPLMVQPPTLAMPMGRMPAPCVSLLGMPAGGWNQGRGGLFQGQEGQRGQGRGYHHRDRGSSDNRNRGGYDNRGRGGYDNRGRGGADNRGRGGYHHRGRGGKPGQGGGERGRVAGQGPEK